MEKRKALGRGLDALIPLPQEVDRSQYVVNIKLTEIISNRYQPREIYSSQNMQGLISSIREKGFLQPIVVRRIPGGYEVIAGERRLRAAKELGMTQVPAIIRDIEKDVEVLEMALIENLQREELNPMEKAKAFKRLMEEFNFTAEKIAQVMGKDSVSIINTVRLLKLPDSIQEKISQGELTEGHGRAILGLEDSQMQINLAEEIIKKALSVRETENLVRKLKGKRSKKTLGIKKDPQLKLWEEELQRIFGTKVKIIHLRERGKIEMEYYSLEDLERLIGLLERAKGNG